MSRIPLALVRWSYDDETNRVVADFQESPGADDPDPAGYVSQRVFSVEFVPENTDSTVLPPPPPPPEPDPAPDPAPEVDPGGP